MKKKLYYILYLTIVTLLCFSGIELYLSYLLNHPEKAPVSWRQSMIHYYNMYDVSIIQQDGEMSRYDESLFYTLAPGEFTFENREFANEYHVNSKGLRDDEASLDYPKIIMLGDSYGMGWGTDQQSNYPQLIEKATGMRTLNAGISSYGTPREMLLLDQLKTDSLEYLIIQFCHNDKPELTTCINNDYHLPISSEHVYDSVRNVVQSTRGYYPFKYCFQLLPLIFNGVEKTQTKATPSQVPLPPHQLYKGFIHLLRNSETIPKNTRIILFQLDSKGDPGRFAFIPNVKSILENEMGSSLQDQVTFIDFSKAFGEEHYFILDPHLNEKGHQLVADSILKIIENDLPVKQTKEWFHDSGEVCIRAEYLGKIKHGKMECFWENGALSLETNYQNGYKHGEEVHYDQSGKLVYRKTFIHGKEQ